MQTRQQAVRCALRNTQSQRSGAQQVCGLNTVKCQSLQAPSKLSDNERSVLQPLSPEAVGDCRSPPPKRLPRRSGQQDGLGLLERLLASSPRPPKWARSRASVEGVINPRAIADELRDVDMDEGPSTGDLNGAAVDPSPLGKWARNSKVGAQVRSAADLHAAEDPTCSQKTLLTISNSQSAGHLERAGSLGLLDGAMYWRPPPEDSETSRCTEYAPGVLQPLPPKPPFPPPPPPTLPILKGMSATKTNGEAEPNELQMSASSGSPSETLDLLTSTLTEDSVFQIGFSRIDGVSEGDPVTAASPRSRMRMLREKVRQLRSDAASVLQPGPDAEEVTLLLHRLESLLQLRCAADTKAR
mmetsp:Transcript_43638/g.79566  ORF Transcript_43638/g.79566 Transcript_43638/m.79566 type:complete len:356 (+) Transcript_43638:51-1118(+)